MIFIMFTKSFELSREFPKPVMVADGVRLGAINISTIGNGDFEINAYGFFRSDIASLNAATSLQEYQLILSRLQSYQANNPDNSKKSVEQIVRDTLPWRAQTPSEIRQVADYVGNLRVEQLEQERERALSREQKTPSTSSVQPSDQPSVQPSVSPVTTT